MTTQSFQEVIAWAKVEAGCNPSLALLQGSARWAGYKLYQQLLRWNQPSYLGLG